MKKQVNKDYSDKSKGRSKTRMVVGRKKIKIVANRTKPRRKGRKNRT